MPQRMKPLCLTPVLRGIDWTDAAAITDATESIRHLLLDYEIEHDDFCDCLFDDGDDDSGSHLSTTFHNMDICDDDLLRKFLAALGKVALRAEQHGIEIV